MDRANIVRNSNGAFKQQPWPAATRRLRQQLPRQRYLTYNICLNHDVVRLHKPVPEPEHGALYSSQAAADGCVRAPRTRSTHIYLPIRVYAPWYRFNVYRSRNRKKFVEKRPSISTARCWRILCIGGERRGQCRFSIFGATMPKNREIYGARIGQISLISLWISPCISFCCGISYPEIDAMVDSVR